MTVGAILSGLACCVLGLTSCAAPGPFRRIDGVDPSISRETAFCGKGSLYMHNTFGLLDTSSRWGRTDLRVCPLSDATCNGPYGWTTDEFSHICMAYRWVLCRQMILQFPFYLCCKRMQSVVRPWRAPTVSMEPWACVVKVLILCSVG